jgi:dihydrofolate synthase/folylpolyglutamate synthase
MMEAGPGPDETGAALPRRSTSAFTPSFARALGYLQEFADLERGGMAAAALGLERTRALLKALDHPECRYPAVLIAGTKGKGSTAAIVERALRAAGYRTGLYTQPHLHTIRERVRIDGSALSQDEFAAALDAVRHAVDQVCAACGPTTAYEVMTAVALDHFANARVDAAVLEVGLGGRLDATNVVEAAVCALTSISLDHTQILGDTVELITEEKADIIKPGRPCVSAPQPAGAMDVIRRVAAERDAPLLVAGANGARWVGHTLHTGRGQLANLQPALRGEHQRINAAVAATVLDALHVAGTLEVPLDAVRTGIEDVRWPGRFEEVSGVPTVVLDGAHNVESARRLRETVRAEFGEVELAYVLGIPTDKDAPGIVGALAPADLVVAVQAAHPRARDAGEVAQLAGEHGIPSVVASSVAEGIATARGRIRAGGLVVVTGSLYVVAEGREALGLAEPSGEGAFNPWATR